MAGKGRTSRRIKRNSRLSRRRLQRFQRGGAPGPDPNSDLDFMGLVDKVIDTLKTAPSGASTATAMSNLTAYVNAIPVASMKVPYQVYAVFLQNTTMMISSASGFSAGLGSNEPIYRRAMKFALRAIGDLTQQVRASTNPPNPYVPSAQWQSTVVTTGTSPNWVQTAADQALMGGLANIAMAAYVVHLYGASIGFSQSQLDEVYSSYIRNSLILLLYAGIMAQSGTAMPAPLQTLTFHIAKSAVNGKTGTTAPIPNLLPTTYPMTAAANRIPISPMFTLVVPTVTLKRGVPTPSGSSATGIPSSASAPATASGPATIQDVMALIASAPDAKVAAATRSFMTSSGTFPGLLSNFIKQIQ